MNVRFANGRSPGLRVAHEFVHVASGDAGHGTAFREISTSSGLCSPLLACPAVNKGMRGRLSRLLGELTPLAPVHPENFSPYRWVRVACSDCGLAARVPERSFGAFGAPCCACNQHPMHLRGRCERSRVTYPTLNGSSE